jgi:hypothetical protein
MTRATKAITTLVVGQKYYDLWHDYARHSWERYAAQHGFDLHIFNQPLDNSARARGRSVSWQKCLVLQQPQLAGYSQVVWIDSDVIINTVQAPDIVLSVPESQIGAVDAYSLFNPKLFNQAYTHYEYLWAKNPNGLICPTGSSFYQAYGINTQLNDVIHAGVMVFNPNKHADLLARVYHHYEDKGTPQFNYEMRPLSYEVVKAGLHHWIDYRFNLIYYDYRVMFYPFLSHVSYDTSVWKRVRRRLVQLLYGQKAYSIEGLACTSAFAASYFIHFAGSAQLMPLVNQEIARLEDFKRYQLKHTDLVDW